MRRQNGAPIHGTDSARHNRYNVMLTLRQRKQLWAERGGKFADVAATTGVTANHIRLVFIGERRSEPVECALAQVMGVPRDVAFPPLPPRTRAPRSKVRPPGVAA